MCWRWKFKSVVQPTVSTNHWQSDLTFVRSGHWELFWSVGISRMICQSDRWLDSGWEKCKCTPADMVIHHWFLLVKNCQIDHVAERVGVVFLRFAVLLGVMWIMFPEGPLTKIAECCQLSLNSDRLRLEHRLPAVDGDCYRSMSAVHQESKTQSVYCWMFWIMFDCIHCGSNLLISAACFGQDSVMLLFFVLISVIYSQLNHIKFDSNSMQASHGWESWARHSPRLSQITWSSCRWCPSA